MACKLLDHPLSHFDGQPEAELKFVRLYIVWGSVGVDQLQKPGGGLLDRIMGVLAHACSSDITLDLIIKTLFALGVTPKELGKTIEQHVDAS